MKYCINCGSKRERHTTKFCSKNCETEHEYKNNVELWLEGKKQGHVNSPNKDIKNFVRKFLLEVQDNKCAICDFEGYNVKTGLPILQIDHIDGDAENSSRENLRAICPNCHAMTENYMNLNRGKGRKNRYGRLAESGIALPR